MRKTLIATTIASALILSACSSNDTQNMAKEGAAQVQDMNANNVLFKPSPLQYMAPEFDKFGTKDYEAAFDAGIAQHTAQVQAIANNPAPATFENTLVKMELSGELLNRVSAAFYNLSGLISDAEYQRIDEKMAPVLSAHSDDIYLNGELFKRVQTIYDNQDKLNAEDKRLVDFYYKQFVKAGAKLNDAEKAKMREINSELAQLSTAFSQNILKSFKEDVIVVTDKSELAGLSEGEIAGLAASAKKAGKDGYMITLVNTTQQPILSSLENRDLRERIFKASANRAAKTNGPIIIKETNLRAQKAELLGYKDWASYVMTSRMAQTTENVYGILDDLAPKAVEKAKIEAAAIQKVINDSGESFELKPWDWTFYAEKVRAEKYNLDPALVKPYFEMQSVIHDGLFFAMNKLYGITFKERKDLPVYHEDVTVYEVFNADGSAIGLFYLDPYAREGKRGGAWMSAYVSESGLKGTKPVIYNAQNIPKPAAGEPTLMTFDEVSTMFHEFGHAAHGLFSDVKYPSLAGTATARDFVEFPSQANEDWMIEPTVLANYAKHYKTGEPIPQALLDKVLESQKFNQGYGTTEYLAAALLDMEWHSFGSDKKVADVQKFEQDALEKHGIAYYPVPPRYKSNFFSHTFAGGYSAGYYAYLWTEVFAADAFAHMENNGGLTRKNGDKFRKEILSKGNSRDLMQSYIEFRGQKPTTDALLKRRGLVE
ncbi:MULTISPECIES: M3 family metallopeptidase [Pseudoalteromonas]|uniref:M3 family metallopeptidase n=2 Tax=Pseudoalteromonas arctica TaxID=394751 RepID=A0AAP6Y117_9GAMM|nr:MULTISPECIES: M3 family metallopeptidase [Pseudoalteromonas]ATC87349.1 peptidyl-dipeptidase Dcp [Pseudoalteromonas arctica A 37-1-2]MBH0004903.1 M3 family metallopeptidase [Pseudoalteromonas sp. SWYJZ12]MBH0014095.1 M3 family metallopeptidase [Pseudoalteromonas sp. NZS100_1]MBH0042697.1 M3 family metallopeptidase [Pseudoalteromonas sp. SWXJZ10B]MBH0049872.1 M3 family metallopeptidase [Pseudoalteromonas sp. SWYJZ19]